MPPVTSSRTFDVGEPTLYGPLRAYRDALAPVAERLLPRLTHLLLAYDDEGQTVYDIRPKAKGTFRHRR